MSNEENHAYNPLTGLHLTTGPHGNLSLYYKDTPWYVHKAVRLAMEDSHMDSQMYKLRNGCSAFFQGGSDNWRGYLYIEFWSHNIEKIQEFVDALNIHIRTIELQYLPICAVHRTLVEMFQFPKNGSDTSDIVSLMRLFPKNIQFENCTFLKPDTPWDYRKTWGARDVFFKSPNPEILEEMLDFLYWHSVPSYGTDVKLILN